MAVVATEVDVEPKMFPYSGRPDAIGQFTNAPRAEVSFQLNGVTVDGPGTGDSIQLTVKNELPIGFAYVLLEAHFGMVVSDATDWDRVAWGAMQNGGGATRTYLVPLEFFSRGLSVDGVRLIWTMQNNTNQVILPGTPQAQSQFKFVVANSSLDGEDALLYSFVRFLQFDIEQAHNYAVNNAIPVR